MVCQTFKVFGIKKDKKIIRDSFPVIRIITVKGEPFYQVDARKTGTSGKRMAFKSKADAEVKANEIAGALLESGIEGIAFDSDLRYQAMKGKALLKPYGKDVLDAVNFYLPHLEKEAKTAESERLDVLLNKWVGYCRSGNKNNPLRAVSAGNYSQHANRLKREFPKIRLRELTQERFQAFLDGLKYQISSKRILLIRTITFINWCIDNGYTDANPLLKIELGTVSKDVEILTIEEADKILRYCQDNYPDCVLYHAISMFAGLRPTECKLLKWENIHIAERQITVLNHTSKIKETRNVPIEDNLAEWLEKYKGKGNSYVTEHVGLRNKLSAIRKEALKWDEKKYDVFRHSYASYWLAKYKDRAHLAENMGNSTKIIGKHYKAVVAESAYKMYWSITSIPDEIKALEKLVKDEGFESLTLEQQYKFLTLHGEYLPVHAKSLLSWEGLTEEEKSKNALLAWEFIQLKFYHPESGRV